MSDPGYEINFAGLDFVADSYDILLYTGADANGTPALGGTQIRVTLNVQSQVEKFMDSSVRQELFDRSNFYRHDSMNEPDTLTIKIPELDQEYSFKHTWLQHFSEFQMESRESAFVNVAFETPTPGTTPVKPFPVEEGTKSVAVRMNLVFAAYLQERDDASLG